MSTQFDLNKACLPEHLLRKVVEKFDYHTGVNFYRTCKNAKEVVEDFNSSWSRNGKSHQYYMFGRPMLGWTTSTGKPKSEIVTKPCQFLKVDTVTIQGCDDQFLQEAVIPQLARGKRIPRLYLRKAKRTTLSDEKIGLIIRAARPYTLSLQDDEFDFQCPHFRNIRHLSFLDIPQKYYGSDVFDISRTHRRLSFVLVRNLSHFLESLIQTWLEGKETGLLEKIRVYGYTNTEEISTLLEKLGCKATESGGYVLEREDGRLMRIKEKTKGAHKKFQLKFL